MMMTHRISSQCSRSSAAATVSRLFQGGTLESLSLGRLFSSASTSSTLSAWEQSSSFPSSSSSSSSLQEQHDANESSSSSSSYHGRHANGGYYYPDEEDHHHLSSSLELTLERVLEMQRLGKAQEMTLSWEGVVRSTMFPETAARANRAEDDDYTLEDHHHRSRSFPSESLESAPSSPSVVSSSSPSDATPCSLGWV